MSTSDQGPEHSDPIDAADRRVEHVLGIYDTDAFLVATVVEFLHAALSAEAMAVATLASGHQAAVREGLIAAGVEVDAARARGDLVQVAADELLVELTAWGSFDVEAYRHTAQALLDAAEARGRALHICGNLHSALWEVGEIEALLELEGTWNRMVGGPPLELLCLYDSRIFDRAGEEDALPALCREHLRLRPVEDLASVVDPAGGRRSLGVLELQRRADEAERERMTEQRETIAAALDRCIDESRLEQHQFERAVASRDVIGQAKGILMVRWRLDAEAAFAVLRDASARSDRKLHEVAAAVVEQQRRLASGS